VVTLLTVKSSIGYISNDDLIPDFFSTVLVAFSKNNNSGVCGDFTSTSFCLLRVNYSPTSSISWVYRGVGGLH
ncbi:hypothetical protein, partial [Pseudomonas carnis]|uniref:hypothetical protein n=1 Tax=Pseudomonas carnis TaxID=2487355 RepID=UPI001F46B2E8